MKKKILIAAAGLFLVLIASAIIIPFVVDVDQYRPEIVRVANEKINGKLELGKLTLSLWGRILIKVDGFKLSDAKGKELVSVQDAHFHLPFTSVFSGSPILNFRMKTPKINVVKDRRGKLNLMSLMKKSTETAPTVPQAGTAPSQPATTTSAKEVALPGLATRARLGIELTNAQISYQDLAQGLKNEINDLNFIVRDISLSRPMELEIWADIETTLGKTLKVAGPFRVEGTVNPTLTGVEFESAAAKLKVDLDKLEIKVPGAFEKTSSIPANMSAELKVTQKDALIEKFRAVFHNAQIDVNGKVTQVQSAQPIVDIGIRSNEIELGPWVKLLPALKEFDLSGTTSFKANASGPSTKLSYSAELKMDNWSAAAPNLKAKPVINGLVQVVTDQVKRMKFTMKAPGNDLSITGNLRSFTQPRLVVKVASSGMDLDQLVKFPPPAKKGAASTAKSAPAQTAASDGGKATGGDGKAAAEDFDKLVDPVRKNPMARAAQADMNIDLKFVKAYGIEIKGIQSKLSFKNLVAAIDYFRLRLWDGSLSTSASVDLKPAKPKYAFKSKIQGINLKRAVESQLELFKNTLLGKLFFNVSGSGSSFNPDSAKKRLSLKGKMKVEDAVFATIDIGRMTTEALNKSMGKLGEKIPQLKGKKINKLPNKESRYRLVSSDFSMANGRFNAPNFVAKAIQNQGIDLEGKTAVGIIDYTLDARWKIVDTYNLTRAKDISVETQGVKVNHLLAKGSPPVVAFPVTVGCKLDSPCYSYSEVPVYLSKVALSNIGSAAKGKVKAEAKKKLQKAIGNKIPKKAPKEVKKLFKKFGF